MQALLTGAALVAAAIGLGWLASRVKQNPKLGRILIAGIALWIGAVFLISVLRGDFLSHSSNRDDFGDCATGQNC